MNNFLVKDLMVPISEYATVPLGTTLFEAVQVLEKAQEEYEHSVYKHRAVLILDESGRVVGKLNQMDALRAIEFKSDSMDKISSIQKFGFTDRFVSEIVHKFRQDDLSLEELYKWAANQKVERFMQTPSEGEYVDEDFTLDAAINQLIIGKLLSLLVTKGDDIVGILRMSDVFAAVFHVMKTSELKETNQAKDES